MTYLLPFLLRDSVRYTFLLHHLDLNNEVEILFYQTISDHYRSEPQLKNDSRKIFFHFVFFLFVFIELCCLLFIKDQQWLFNIVRRIVKSRLCTISLMKTFYDEKSLNFHSSWSSAVLRRRRRRLKLMNDFSKFAFVLGW